MAYLFPSVSDFKSYFDRDFPYAVPASGIGGDNTDVNKVRDQDITNAIAKTQSRINNSNLYADQPTFTIAALLMSAHFLVNALVASSQGVSGQGAGWLVNSKSVGNVSMAQEFPDKVKRSPAFAPFLTTAYGSEYVAMTAPLCVANLAAAPRMSSP